MAKNIKGIIIEIGGETTDLQKALKQPEAQAKALSSELTQINKALRLDPSSMDLLGQRSTVLSEKIAATTDKLLLLRQASKQMQDQAARGDIGEDQYREFQREIVNTENELRSLQNSVQDTDGRMKVLNGDVKSAADSASVFEQAIAESEQKLKEAAARAETFRIALGNLIASGIKAATNALREFSGQAIERYDILNRFPRIMEQIGIESSVAQAATEKLVAGIAGLPTTLTDVIETAQYLTTMTGNLEESVDVTLALNNAFLASGASASDASRGVTQYIQQLSKGAVDMMSWRTLQETMGFALKETAEDMGFAGKAATTDLYKALQSGTVTFDEFNDKLIELSEATGGFSDMARTASQGIGTSFTNMKTAVIRGLTSIIQAIDKNRNIQIFLESTGKGFENLLRTIGSMASIVTTLLAPALWLLANGMGAVLQALIPLTAAFVAYKATLIITSILQALSAGFTFLEAAMIAMPALMNLVTIAQTKLNLAMTANPIGLQVAAIAALVAGLIALYNWFAGTTKKQKEASKSTGDLTKSLNTSTSAIGKNVTAAEGIAKAGDGIAQSYNTAAEGVKNLTDEIFDSVKEAKKAADEYNKQFTSTGHQLVLDAQGRARVISRSSMQMYEVLKSYIDEYYQGASQIEKYAAARTIYTNKETLEQIKRDYYGVGPAIGASLADGMSEGINNRRSQVINSVRSLTQDVKKEFEKGLDINSPSGVTEKYGEYTIEGFVNSILRGRRSVKEAMASMIDSVKGELSAVTTAIIPSRQPSMATAGGAGVISGSSSVAYTNIYVQGLTEVQEYLAFVDNQRRRGRALNGER